ncbi:hypothetical protein SYNPS1DRAFT_31068 [Syncephalis pseudoplumigaleata]|uniref:Uncharacterized protein n=1 Tax=Syncephalis pseudoplumigaleata TaxID=1712513 RepID=A0A4P9YUY8_9FUNG|nr:hypothetical protein SYNPS1DRAFT_31068 [Syncephalis pseudoplumigaleata]|eukprot:RKP23222.1 hypothetical protein SYNPS1DRAFT_31068 [Syncephalis pseudoplumigaleata]
MPRAMALPILAPSRIASVPLAILDDIALQYMHNPGARPPWAWDTFPPTESILGDLLYEDGRIYVDSIDSRDMDAARQDAWLASSYAAPPPPDDRMMEMAEYERRQSVSPERHTSSKWYPMAHRHLFVHRPSSASSEEEDADEHSYSAYYRRKSRANHQRNAAVRPREASHPPPTIERRSGGTQRFLMANPPGSMA